MYLCKNHLDWEEWWYFIQQDASTPQISSQKGSECSIAIGVTLRVLVSVKG